MTNNRYLNFRQQHFTAGDEEQFESHRNKTNSFSPHNTAPCISSEVELVAQIRWEKYRQLCPSDVSNTFRYIFHKFKKGIFVQIKDNQVRVMLPFSKNNFVNEWSTFIQYDPTRYGCWNDLFRTATENAGYTFVAKSVHQHREKWYANNGLIRYEFPIKEGDTGVALIEEMLTTLCSKYSVPDMEFFINRRDFPILTRDGTEAYDCLFGETTLVSHNYDRYVPILSMCSGHRYADIPIPNTNDWEQSSNDTPYNLKWDTKKPVAVFRGSSTGLGVTKETNPRLFVAHLGYTNTSLLDAGLTKWNTRPRKSNHSKYFDTIRDTHIPLKPPLTPYEQASYKYIIHIGGHVCAYRLSRELSYGSVILMVKSDFYLWFSHLLLPYVHYVPVKADCSDLIDRIEWCKKNDSACQVIANNAVAFWKEHLTRDRLLQYLQTTLVRIKQRTGTYQYRIPSVMDEMEQMEDRILREMDTELSLLPEYPHPPTLSMNNTRDFGWLQGVRWFFTRFSTIFSAYTRKAIHNGNRNRTMNSIQVNDLHMLCKTHVTTHEYFIGMTCINHLLRYIPNFSYTFGRIGDTVYSEFFEGAVTLFEYIQDPAFSFDTFIHIIFQIGLILHEAQYRVGFVHWDLTAWNVIIRFRETPTTVQYYYSYNQTALFTTDLDVVLIDYEKSHCIWNGFHYGKIKPFQLDTIHDILTLLITSIFAILRYQTLNKRDMAQVFILASFFGGTSYTNYQNFRTLYDLKAFLNKAKKFSQLIDAPKGDLASKTPLSLIYFLQDKFGKTLDFSSTHLFQMHKHSSGEVYAQLCQQPYNLDEQVSRCPIKTMTVREAMYLYTRLASFGTRFNRVLVRLEKHILQSVNYYVIPSIPDTPDYTVESFDEHIESKEKTMYEDITQFRMECIEFLMVCPNKSFLMKKWKELFLLDSIEYKSKVSKVNTFNRYNNYSTK